jgi:biotin---protein ligase
MKKILIYSDKGTNPFCINSLIDTFRDEKFDHAYDIVLVDRYFFHKTDWQKNINLVIFPGGRDVPYHNALLGLANQNIKDFVSNGGKYLGICAGGYYGSAIVEFEKDHPLEIIAKRELKFFPGIARGPAYGSGKFCYESTKGAKIAKLHLFSASTIEVASYFNGGCEFVDAEKYDTVSVIARYADIVKQPAAIIKCKVGMGLAILSGVHPEYSAFSNRLDARFKGSLLVELKKNENKRRIILKSILNLLDL